MIFSIEYTVNYIKLTVHSMHVTLVPCALELHLGAQIIQWSMGSGERPKMQRASIL